MTLVSLSKLSILVDVNGLIGSYSDQWNSNFVSHCYSTRQNRSSLVVLSHCKSPSHAVILLASALLYATMSVSNACLFISLGSSVTTILPLDAAATFQHSRLNMKSEDIICGATGDHGVIKSATPSTNWSQEVHATQICGKPFSVHVIC
jgi:hypothetical protein